MYRKKFLSVLLLCLFISITAKTVKIGILARQGKQSCLDRWSMLSEHLNQKIPDYDFQIIPITFDNIENSVKTNSIDFLLANPHYYILIEKEYQASRIATIEKKIGDIVYNKYAGVIFTRADNNDIQTLPDLKGKKFSAVSNKSFGGFHLAWYLLKKNNIDIEQDLNVSFAGTHSAVVYDVLNRKTDAGTIRSGVLEEMSANNEIDLQDVKLVSAESDCEDFPLVHSTCLYPEWPMAKLQNTPKELAKKLAVALFEMKPNSAVAQQAGIWGWTFPSNYQPVHNVIESLEIRPYEKENISFIKVIVDDHLTEFLVIVFFIIIITYLAIKLFKSISKEKFDAALVNETQSKLQGSQANLKALIESTDDVIVSFDRDGKLLICNSKFAEVVKKSSGLDIEPGMNLLEITPPDQKNFWQNVYKRALEGKRFTEVMTYHKNTENQRYYHITFNPIIKNGKVVGFTEFSRDMSELKNAENELRKMYKAVEQSANSIIITDLEGNIEFVNQTFYELTGYSHAEVIGHNPRILKSGKHPDKFYKNLWDTIKAGKNWHGEFLNKKKNGDFYWEAATIAPVKNKDDEIINFMAVKEDITKRKQAQQQLQEANQKLRELSENLEEKVNAAVAEIQEKDHMLIAQSKQAAMGEMIANIAHQWRQPLSAVAAIVQDIEDAYEFEELTQEYLENSVKKTMQQIQYMSQTIDDFRNFFNPNKSKIDFNIKEKIDKTLGFLASSIKQYNIDIIQDIDENCSCNGYPNEFSQVILNIINNAKDAIKENTPDKPYIKISCERTAKEKNIIKISNNGGQIPQDKLQTIFQPYYTTKKDGTGLGLYMSKMIVERNLKGSIEIKNMENGVEFKIEI
jgi:phosphate/phosphite/phosphonate ABC transporter binding protein